MKTKQISIIFLLLVFAFLSQPANAQFIKIDDFTNSALGVLSTQASDGPSNYLWSAKGAAGAIVVTNSATPGAGQPGSGTPLTSTALAAATTAGDGVAYIPLPVTISTTNTKATVFIQFDMGTNLTANNVNWDLAPSIGNDGGGSLNEVELNANVPSRAGLTINNGPPGGGKNFVEMSADGVNVFQPLASTIYNIWFVIDNAANNFIIYMQDASPTGTDLPNLTRMQISTTGAPATITGPETFTTNAIGYRSSGSQPMTYFAFGEGGGGDSVQYLYSIYEDPSSVDLTNPVTGAAPIFVTPPVILSEPQPEQVYAGDTAAFTVSATGGSLHYQWQTNGVALVDAGNISGSTSPTLTITNVSAVDVRNYVCVITNSNPGAYRSTNTTAVSLQLVSPNGAFETALAADKPLHFYAFDDTGDPSLGTEVAFDYAGGDNGVYATNTQNGFDVVPGPRPVPDNLPGFSSGNFSAEFFGSDEPSHVTLTSPWNLNTNTVTITAWINPGSAQNASTAIVFNRGGGSDVEGLNFSASGDSTLGYTWNNDAGTTSWDSGLQPPAGEWSFVALIVTPTNATIDMMNTNGLQSSSYNFNNVPAAFGGTTMIGDDSGTTSGARTFIGSIDEVAVFNRALTQTQVQSLFTSAAGALNFPASNTVTLVTPTPIYPAQTVQFSSVNSGSFPQTYEWQLNNANLSDGPSSIGVISGSGTPDLTISNLAAGTAGQTYNLTLVTSNASGPFTSSPAAILTVSTTNPNQSINTETFEAAGSDWNTGSSWSDGNPVSVSVFAEPNSTYQIVPGTMERTPGSTNASFPGNVLTIEGDGVLVDGGLSTFNNETTTGELRLKQSGMISVTNFGTTYNDGGSIFFPDLQLSGGQIDNATSSKVTLNGKLEVLGNSTIYADSASGGSIRSIQINSLLTGTGTITYTYLSTAISNNDLIVSGTSNTFSGQWNVGQGTLLGNALNSLGTNNSITVGTNGVLETTYNLDDPNGNLVLNGKMFLYTADTFNAVTINGINLAAGAYSFAQLNSAYPTNFPATWPVQIGSSTGTNTGTGGITVLATLLPQITQQPTPATLSLYPGQTAQFTVTAISATSYQWWFTNLSNVGSKLNDVGVFSGTKSNVLTITGVGNGNAGTYSVVISNAVGPITSSNAVLNILTPGSPTLITMSAVETAGQDWDTGINWSDGNPVSLSAYSEPGSTYEVLSGALLRTPASPANLAFPGSPLLIDSGAELLLEHPSGAASVAFPDLQLNGSMDNGADGLVTLTGQIDIPNPVTIYTDTNSPPGTVVNFDVPGGVDGVNYAGLGAYRDQQTNTYWNPIVQSSGTGTTTSPATNSDGVSTSPVTLTLNTAPFGEGTQYGSYSNVTGTPTNAVALEDNYFYIENNSVPTFVQDVITSTLDNVPAGTYNLYLYGNNGGNTGALGGYKGSGQQNDWSTIFTVSSDVTPQTSLIDTNQAASYASNKFILGADYVVFSNIVVGGGGTITFTYTANTNYSSFALGGQDQDGAFNGLQLAAVVPPTPGPRPFKINSLLTGNGTVNFNAGDSNLTSDLNIAGTANTFSGQWNVLRGVLLGSGSNSLGTNSITVSAGGGLETAYNINDTTASLVLNGQMFLHQADTFRAVTVNGVSFSPGTYSFSQLHSAFPLSFPATWPLQTGSAVNTGSGSLTVLTGPPPSAKPAKIVSATLAGNTLTLAGTNGAPSGTYHVLTTTNLVLSVSSWLSVTNGAFDGSGDFNITVPYSSADKQRFYLIKSP